MTNSKYFIFSFLILFNCYQTKDFAQQQKFEIFIPEYKDVVGTYSLSSLFVQEKLLLESDSTFYYYYFNIEYLPEIQIFGRYSLKNDTLILNADSCYYKNIEGNKNEKQNIINLKKCKKYTNSPIWKDGICLYRRYRNYLFLVPPSTLKYYEKKLDESNITIVPNSFFYLKGKKLKGGIIWTKEDTLKKHIE